MSQRTSLNGKLRNYPPRMFQCVQLPPLQITLVLNREINKQFKTSPNGEIKMYKVAFFLLCQCELPRQ